VHGDFRRGTRLSPAASGGMLWRSQVPLTIFAPQPVEARAARRTGRGVRPNEGRPPVPSPGAGLIGTNTGPPRSLCPGLFFSLRAADLNGNLMARTRSKNNATASTLGFEAGLWRSAEALHSHGSRGWTSSMPGSRHACSARTASRLTSRRPTFWARWRCCRVQYLGQGPLIGRMNCSRGDAFLQRHSAPAGPCTKGSA
jgi:hypothetical protein